VELRRYSNFWKRQRQLVAKDMKVVTASREKMWKRSSSRCISPHESPNCLIKPGSRKSFNSEELKRSIFIASYKKIAIENFNFLVESGRSIDCRPVEKWERAEARLKIEARVIANVIEEDRYEEEADERRNREWSRWDRERRERREVVSGNLTNARSLTKQWFMRLWEDAVWWVVRNGTMKRWLQVQNSIKESESWEVQLRSTLKSPMIIAIGKEG